jgi:5-methylcytosine-specific restriction protein A
MPYAPARPCSRPCCPRLLAYGEQCPDHGEKARKRENDREPKRKAKRRFYQSEAWRLFREDKLEREPICRICGKAPSTCVDHKVPVEERPDLALDDENTQGACWSCHSAKTASQDGGFGNRRRSA